MEEGVSWVRAVDSFIAQNEHDLGFKEGDLIQLLRFADENWAVGKLSNGTKQGIFPICFTEPHHPPSDTSIPEKIAKSGLNGIIIDNSHHLELGAKIEVLSEKDSSNWVVREFNSDDVFTINKRMIEITKLNWKRNKSPEPAKKTSSEKKKNMRMTTIWKEPDKIKNRQSSDLSEIIKVSEHKNETQKTKKARPKSYAEPSNVELEETKRRSYQEATEGQWERTIIDRIVANDNAAQKLVRNQPGRKSLKDIFRSSIKLENGSKNSDKKEKEFLFEKILKSEKEIKKLEEKFTRVGESDELEKIKKLIKMEETTLNRLKKEVAKFKESGHSRMSSAPVDIPNRTTSLPPDSDPGDEVRLVNAIYELRDTELTFHKDITFILTELVDMVPPKHQEFLFGGLEELQKFSRILYDQLLTIANKKNRYEQCMLIYKLFLDQLVSLREGYAPYCARQSQVASVLCQIPTEVALIEEKISQSRRDGKTQAFNLNSLLIKPVQRVTKYPLLLEQIMKAAPQDSRLPLRDAVKEMKSTLLEINNQKRQFEIVDSVINPKPDKNSNLGIESEENPMKKIKKKFDRIMNPMPRDDNDPVEVEYKIMCNIERRVKEFIDEVVKLVPIVRSLCPENMLAHEFEMCTIKQVVNPLREMQTLFVTPHKLIQKWRDKYSDSIRLYQSNPELSQQSRQIFSALNAQLMAELPKLCSLSESLLLASMTALTSLLDALMGKVSLQRPHSNISLDSAKVGYREVSSEIWKTIYLFQSLHFTQETTPPSRKNNKPILNKTTQTADERQYVLDTYQSNLYEVKQRWVSGDVADCWVSPGDIVYRLETVPSGVDKTKVRVDSGRKKGFVPLNVLTEFPSPKRNDGKSQRRQSLKGKQLFDFEQQVLGNNDSCESDSLSEAELVNVPNRTDDLIKFHDSAVAQFDFKGRTVGELSVSENELVTVLARHDLDGNSEWFKVQNKFGEIGYVPSSYLKTAS